MFHFLRAEQKPGLSVGVIRHRQLKWGIEGYVKIYTAGMQNVQLFR